MLSRTDSKSPCDSVLPWLIRMVFLRTDWEYHTARFMRNVWMVDCNSLNDHLFVTNVHEVQRQETQHRFGCVATNGLAHS